MHMYVCVYIYIYMRKDERVSLSLVSDSLWPHGLEPPGPSVQGILQVRILERVAILIWTDFCGILYSSDGKESACNSGDPGSIPGSGRSPGERNGNPLQYFCWRIFGLDRGVWRAPVHGVTKSQTWLSTWAQRSTCTHTASLGLILCFLSLWNCLLTKMCLQPLNQYLGGLWVIHRHTCAEYQKS